MMDYKSELEFERLMAAYTAAICDLCDQRRSPDGWFDHASKRYVKSKLDLYLFVSDVRRSENKG